MMNEKEQIDLARQDLIIKFAGREYVYKPELREFYRLRNRTLSEQAFRRIMYALEREKFILPLGAGVYGWLNPPNPLRVRNRFSPNLSQSSQNLGHFIRENFLYSQYVLWETRILHELMTHQPGQNQIILEIEKDVMEPVFNRMRDADYQNVFINPSKGDIQHYSINIQEAILIFPLINQSPKMRVNQFDVARLEKILVDVFYDEEHFFIYQGQELINIFENAFSYYWINPRTLFRYAGRRKVSDRLEKFITTQTQIKTLSNNEKMS